MMIERTFDYDIVREIITHPKLYPFCTEDGAPEPKNFNPVENNQIYYLLPIVDEPIGVIIFSHQNAILLAVHICILPEWWGYAKEAATSALWWIFQNTDYTKITGALPEYNRQVYNLGLRAGFEDEGRHKKAFLKNGKEWDLILMGIRKETICPLK
jgi:RimJ/RimL family protein N-acetyltransferase